MVMHRAAAHAHALFDGGYHVSGHSEQKEPVLTQKHHTFNPYKRGHAVPRAAAGAGGGARNCRGEIGRNPPARISFNDGGRDRKRALEI